MSISSMTAFACCHGDDPMASASDDGTLEWTWEIRSVNAKGLDVRLRLPQGFESLEFVTREIVRRYCRRGTLLLTLTMRQPNNQNMLRLDENVLLRLLIMMSEWQKRYPDLVQRPPRLDSLLSLPGVLVSCEENENNVKRQERETSILLSLEQTLDALVTMRREEGSKLTAVLEKTLDTIEELIRRAFQCAESQPIMILTRLRKVIETLSQTSLSEERLTQEVVLSAARADVREELDRLHTHALTVRQLLREGGVVGRRLDFLCQELHREANTLCTKANSLDLTYIGIDLKTTIDQLREQVQNIE